MKICPVHKSNTFIKAAVKWNAFSDAPSLSEYRNSQKVQSCKQKIDSCSKKGEREARNFSLHLFLLTDRRAISGYFAQYCLLQKLLKIRFLHFTNMCEV